jgi:hypothetical protein
VYFVYFCDDIHLLNPFTSFPQAQAAESYMIYGAPSLKLKNAMTKHYGNSTPKTNTTAFCIVYSVFCLLPACCIASFRLLFE